MTVLARRALRHSPSDRRGFAVFLACQALVLAGALFFTEWLPLILLGALCAMLFVFSSLSRPWIIVPLVVLTTGLDSTGRLFAEAGKAQGGFHLTGFHLAFGLLLVAMSVRVSLTRRTHFPDFELKAPLFMFLGCIQHLVWPNKPRFKLTVALQSNKMGTQCHIRTHIKFNSLVPPVVELGLL